MILRRQGMVVLLVMLAWSSQGLAAAQLPPQAEAGDLLFRQGAEPVSHLVRSVDRGDFSHVGMLVGTPGHWQVLHATPSERPGQADAVVLDALDFFLQPQRTQAYRLYRVGAGRGARQKALEWALAQQGQPFQLQGSERSVYCTTLVWQAWMQAGVDLDVLFTQLDLPLLGGRYLLPSSLQRSPLLQPLTPLLQMR